MNTPIILGVDPGATGALAAINASTGDLIWIEDMPMLDRTVSGPLVADLLRNEDIVAAWIEHVWAMSPMGASASFSFGHGTGVITGVLAALDAPTRLVKPAVWKKAVGLGRDKDASRAAAVGLWPASSALFARKKDDGRAEAALIARHGWLTHRHGSAAA